MKVFGLIAVCLLMSGCFAKTRGTFTGRLVDVEWGGAIFESCEMGFQYGEQSSTISKGSNLDKEFCDKAAELSGKTVVAKYRSTAGSCPLSCETSYIVESVEPAH